MSRQIREARCLTLESQGCHRARPNTLPHGFRHPHGGIELWLLPASTPHQVFHRPKLEKKITMNPSLKIKTPLVTSATLVKLAPKPSSAKETKKNFPHHHSSRDNVKSCRIALILRDSRTFSMSSCISETRIYTQCTDETVDSACYQSNALKS